MEVSKLYAKLQYTAALHLVASLKMTETETLHPGIMNYRVKLSHLHVQVKLAEAKSLYFPFHLLNDTYSLGPMLCFAEPIRRSTRSL